MVTYPSSTSKTARKALDTPHEKAWQKARRAVQRRPGLSGDRRSVAFQNLALPCLFLRWTKVVANAPICISICHTHKSNVIWADVLDRRWLGSISHREMPQIHNTSNNKLKASGTITIHLCIDEARTRANFGVVRKLVFRVLLGTMFIDNFIISIYPAEWKVAPYDSHQTDTNDTECWEWN